MRTREVVVGVEVAVHVDNPGIEAAVVHTQATERTGPEIRASCRVIPKFLLSHICNAFRITIQPLFKAEFQIADSFCNLSFLT